MLLAACALLGGAIAVRAAPPHALAGGAVVVDWRTGLALHGMDPVAYFSEARAAMGRPGIELSRAGAVWRFRSQANRAAFAAHPEVYLPQFGGYDPLAAARGVATPGSPLLWLVFKDRLYMFHDLQARSAFLADPQGSIAAAYEKWPGLAKALEATGSASRVRRGGAGERAPPDRRPR